MLKKIAKLLSMLTRCLQLGCLLGVMLSAITLPGGCSTVEQAQTSTHQQTADIDHHEPAITHFSVPIENTQNGKKYRIDVWGISDQPLSGRPYKYALPSTPVITLKLPAHKRVRSGLALDSSVERPVIVYSHGARGIAYENRRLIESLAEAGFVVLALHHPGDSRWDAKSVKKLELEQSLQSRRDDIQFLMREIMPRLNKHQLFNGAMDTQRIGLLGYSRGGETALWASMPNAWRKDWPELPAMSMDATLQRFSPDEIRQIQGPVLLTQSRGTIEEDPPENTRKAFKHLRPTPGTLVEIYKTRHTHFSDVYDIGSALQDAGVDTWMWKLVGAGKLKEAYDEVESEETISIEKMREMMHDLAIAFFKQRLTSELPPDHTFSQLGEDYEGDLIIHAHPKKIEQRADNMNRP